ncbi:MAG: hypothetical protein ACOH13_12675 [Flavobacteriales bacterium]
MNTNTKDPGTPDTDTDTQTEKEATPRMPERPRKHEVEAVRSGFLVTALLAGTMMFAQTTPPPPPPTAPMQPTTKPATPQKPEMPPATAKPMPGQMPATARPMQQPVPAKGWMMFDDKSSADLKLQGDQLQRLQDVDNRYKERYTGMGTTPWTNPEYKMLTEQRNNDVKGILTPEQYKQWSSTHGVAAPGTKTMMPMESR